MWLSSLRLLLITSAVLIPATAPLSPDGLALLAFKSAVSSDPSSVLSSWAEDDPDPCRWPGVSCANVSDPPTPRVVGVAVSSKNLSGYIPSELGSLLFLRRLNLHGNRLSGPIPSQLSNASSLHSLFLYDNRLSGPFPPSLCDLPRLQNLDLSANSLSGPVPPDLRNCRQLQRLLLARNNLSGAIPPGVFPEMVALSQLDLSSNRLSGRIPPDMGSLGSLSGTLNLSHNQLTGRIPPALGDLPSAAGLDLRFNNLSGEIPQAGSLANQGPTAFLNNPGLCGLPLRVPCPLQPPLGAPPAPPAATVAAPAERGGRLRPATIVLISVADAVGVAAIGLAMVYAYWKVKDQRRGGGCSCAGKAKLGGEEGGGKLKCCCCWAVGEDEESVSDKEGGRLVAIDKGLTVELDELLRASAYVLGKGAMGIVYKVVLGNGMPVAVRRLGDGGGGGGGRGHKEFAAEMAAIGRVRHPNVVRLRAYYWAPDEKLLISDFVNNGNLATALRGRSGQPGLSWSIRLRIVKGAARGLAHLHECSPRKFVHGDVKPTNILLDADYNPYISDVGLTRLITITAGSSAASSSSSTGGGFMGLPSTKPAVERPNHYRAPEARVPGARPTQKWDVYSLGVVLLELLTGRPPEPTSSPSAASSSMPPPVDHVPELVRWVRRAFDEARPLPEMVDPVLLREVHAKKEVLSVFHVALACTEADPESRPRMKVVSENLDKVGP